MPNDKKDNVIRPVAGDHSIVRVSFGFEWDEPLSQELFSKLASMHSTVRDYLPIKREIRQAISVDVTGSKSATEMGEVQSPREDHLAAILMDCIEDKFLVRQVIIEPKRITLSDFGKYDKWSAVKERSMQHLQPFLDAVLAERQMRVIGLQYLDSFEAISEEPVAPQVFDRNDLLPEGIFGRIGPWHIHQGYFVDVTDPLACILVTNVNIRIFGVDEVKQILEVKTSHRVHFDSEAAPYDHLKLNALQDSLHKDNKAILRKILLPEIKKMINLDEGE